MRSESRDASATAETASIGDDAAAGGRFGCDDADAIGIVARADGAVAPLLQTIAARSNAIWRLGGPSEKEREGVGDGWRDDEASE